MQKLYLIMIVLLVGASQKMIAQINNDAIPPGTYIINGLEIIGTDRYSTSQIVRFTGLEKGKSIQIPGNDINTAIKKLWNTERFSDVAVYAKKVEGDQITLMVELIPTPQITAFKFEGISKSKGEKFTKDYKLKPGDRLTDALRNKINNRIKGYYTEKGFADAKVKIKEIPTNEPLQEEVLIQVDKGKRVKIDAINIDGNDKFSANKIKSKLKKTKVKNVLRFWKASKYNPDVFQKDLQAVDDYLKSEGFRDAKITSTKVSRDANNQYVINIDLEEGNRYYLGDVNYIGNSVYNTDLLKKIFTYQSGDPYDAVGIGKKVSGSEKDDDISTLYQDNGYMFSTVQYIEKSVHNDTIDVDIRIKEGSQASWDRVTFEGNTTTHDHVVQRSLKTLPGELFSKSDFKRTYFELASTPYFEAQELSYDLNPNPETNTVDVNWKVSEKPSSQVQLQGGYGGGRFIGTVGLTFQNFSLSNMFKGKWDHIVPQGDGQQLQLQAQAGANYQNYSFTFMEPWITSKKPTSLSVSFYYTYLNNTYGANSNLGILGANVGMNRRLSWPDDYFSVNQSLGYQRYKFNNYPFTLGTITLQNGNANNFAYSVNFGRYSSGPDQIFPTSGSEFEIGGKFTPPYSLFNSKDYASLSETQRYKTLEYYKIKTHVYWYKEIIGKLVLKAGGEYGFLDDYNKKVGLPPFERFYLGGTGLTGNRFDGREIIPLRGYQDATNTGGQSGSDITPLGGGTVYSKYVFELRYPITMTSQTAKIYGLTFFEAGNTWTGFSEFQPFELKRSAGFGIRVFMQQFGLLGFDFGYGFDNPLYSTKPSGWQTHFIFGQQF